MLSSVFFILNVLVFAFFALIGVLVVKFIGLRVQKKLSVNLIGLYTLVLLFSSVSVGFIGEDVSKRDDPIEVPPFYFEEVLEDFENRSLKELHQDEFIYPMNETEIPVVVEDFTEEYPLIIPSSEYGQIYGNHLIIEVSDEVDSIVITQFSQKSFTDYYDITKDLNPWHWSITNRELIAEIPMSHIDIYSLLPPSLAFHFDQELLETLQEDFAFYYLINEGAILWIQLPEGLEFEHRGNGPWRIKE